MFTEERQREILNILRSKRKVEVNELCALFNVTSATIRTDLTYLENQGLLKRTHGGAIPNRSVTYEMTTSEKEKVHLAEKLRMGEFAASLVRDGDSIAIDSGTTGNCLVEFLSDKKNLTVITNDLKQALTLEKYPNVTTIFIGGSIRKGHCCSVGPFATNMTKDIHVDKCFIATNSVDEKLDLSTPDADQAEYKKSLIATGNHKYLLCDSAKFGDSSLVKFASVTDFELVISDKSLTKEIELKFREKGISYKLV